MQKTVNVTNSGMVIRPYQKYKSKVLEYETSKWDPVYHKRQPVSGFYNDDDDSFATHKFDINFIRSLFPTHEIVYEPVIFGLPLSNPYTVNSYIEFTESQENVLAQSLTYLNSYHKLFINVPTGVGKTLMTIELISKLNRKCIIFCYSTKILRQWEDELMTNTNIGNGKILILESSNVMEKIRNGEIKFDISNIDIFLITQSLIDSYCKRYGWDKLTDLYNKLGIGIQIIDEAHRRMAATIKLNAYVNPNYHIYLSADFNQANYENRRHFFKVFNNVPVTTVSDTEMVKLRHIKAVVCKFDSNPPVDAILDITVNRYHWDLFKFVKYQHSTKKIYRITRDIIHKIHKTEPKMKKPYKILILLNMIEHVDDYTNMLRMDFPNCSVGKVHSAMDEDERNESLKADIIVSTYQSFNLMEPKIRHCISTAPVDIVSNNQAAGRCRQIEGLWSYYWMIVDTSFEFCIKNLNRSLAYLQRSKIGAITNIDMKGY